MQKIVVERDFSKHWALSFTHLRFSLKLHMLVNHHESSLLLFFKGSNIRPKPTKPRRPVILQHESFHLPFTDPGCVSPNSDCDLGREESDAWVFVVWPEWESDEDGDVHSQFGLYPQGEKWRNHLRCSSQYLQMHRGRLQPRQVSCFSISLLEIFLTLPGKIEFWRSNLSLDIWRNSTKVRIKTSIE